MALFSQEKHRIRITTPLGRDVLHVSEMSGSEGMSQLFSFDLTLLSENQGISFSEIIGKGVTLTLDLPNDRKRHYHGIISRFAQVSGAGTTLDDTRTSSYRATMVPWLWLLTRSAESRIYQNKSVPEIVEQVFKDKGFSDFQFKLQGTYEKLDYCVQYRETHFNFVARLLEEQGIYYFFEHSDARHRMIIADAPQANPPCPGQKSASYSVQPSASADEDLIVSLEKSQEIRAAKYSLNDYNFEIPNTALNVDLPSKSKLGPGQREIYDYPGEYAKKAEGERYARIRMEEEEAQITTIAGIGSCRAFTSGYRFTLENFYRPEMNGKEFVLTTVRHKAAQSVQEGGSFEYRNSFTCIPATVPFRPLRITPRPVVHGSQTAIVVGPAGEEIYPDKHGRVKIQFHWDRVGKKDEKSSCWVRVSQLWAGASWGAMFIPRIGQEVVVDFLEGDPDQPIITGRVYNGVNMPPYPLPDNKTRSTIKSNSTPGGGGFNELRFEDKKDNEEIFLHGQKNWTISILHDKSQTIGNDETLSVGNNRTKDVKKDQSETIGENKTISVGKNHTETIGENASVDIGKNRTEQIGNNSDISVAKDLSLQVGKNSATQVSENMMIDVGRKLTITAADQIVLQAGDASIILKKNGNVIIKGSKISSDASGNILMKAAKVLSN